jgi:integrase
VIRRRHRIHKLKVVSYHHGRSGWTISGHYVHGKRVRRFFNTRDDADTFLRHLRVKQENLGTHATAIDQRLHVMAVESAERLNEYGRTIADATAHYIRHLEATQTSRTIEEATREFLRDKRADGKSEAYVRAMFFVLRRFKNAFPNKLVSEIAAAEIDDWLRSLKLEPLTRNNHRRVVGTLFNYALVRRYCSENPILLTSRAKLKSKPVGILTPDETQRLLDSAEPAIQPALAIGAFGGLRPAEIARLDWSEVMLDRGYIEVTAAKSKTASRRLVKILPNLTSWIEAVPNKTGAVMPPNGRKLTDAARIRAGLAEWPSNALRHSYGTYHLAEFQDAAALALEMGHTTTAVLFAHYREVVTPEAADSYWRIVPKSRRTAPLPTDALPLG